MTSVALYDTLGTESMEYIMSQCRVTTMVLSSDKVKVITGNKKGGNLKDLKNLIYFDPLSEADKAAAEAATAAAEAPPIEGPALTTITLA